jgi:hypothetical protein
MDALKTASRLRVAALFHMEEGNVEASVLMSRRAAQLEREVFAPAVTASTEVTL